ncbi:MAG: CBS domain-containing protein [Pseudonocardia sp.]
MRVDQVMSSPAVTVTPTTPVKDAATLLARRNFTVLPVVDGDLELVGIVSEGDLVLDRFPLDPRHGPVGRTPPVPTTVGGIMTQDVVVASPAEDVRALVRRMREARVRAVPVCDGPTVAGVVTLRDLVAIMSRNDERIAAELRRRLDGYASAGRYEVEVHDGEAVVTDRSADRREWHTVRVLAEQVPGVLWARVTGPSASATPPSHGCRSHRREFYHDTHAPLPNSITPTAFALARDSRGRVLLVRRSDNGNWELPGGRIELGESAVAATVREVAEESGVVVALTGLAGVYSDPGHVMAYPDTGEVRQQFALCFHATPVSGTPHPDHDETSEAAWVEPGRVPDLPIHPSMRQRIRHGLLEPHTVEVEPEVLRVIGAGQRPNAATLGRLADGRRRM